jgi:hypothetical protein
LNNQRPTKRKPSRGQYNRCHWEWRRDRPLHASGPVDALRDVLVPDIKGTALGLPWTSGQIF